MKRKLVYFAHPLRGADSAATEANRVSAGQLVCHYVREAEERGEPIAPVAAWIHLAEHWSEADGRELGLVIDCRLIEACDELWIIGPYRPLSPGMCIERDHAYRRGVTVVDKRDGGA